MKHNEVKAFFKSKLKEELPEYTILSIDETMSQRNIFIVDKKLKTKYYIDCWFATNDYHVILFEINKKIQTGKVKLNKYKDYILDIKGNYFQLDKLSDIIDYLKSKICTKK